MASPRVIDDSDALTLKEVRALKDIASYYTTGRIVISVVIALGVLATTVIQLFNMWKGVK